ncbi:MAG: AAA family ATPase [Coriobacteriia bacterium]|nr:AAA family ATPase [Coriobacteriia bacterium]
MKQRRYYLMGTVGAGKSTLRKHLARQLPAASIYPEWPEPMARRVGHAMDTLDIQDAESVQSWIFTQLGRKNALVSADPAQLLIIDRSPLDTFAFYPPQLWQQRARQLLDLPAPSAGELIFVHGNPATMHARMDSSRGYTVNTLAAQQSAFELLLDWLQHYCGYTARRINTDGLNPSQIAQRAQEIIAERNYQELDIAAAIQQITAQFPQS